MDRDLAPYIRAWRERFRQAGLARQARAAEARAALPRLARHLAERYHARRVWVFGSLVEGGFDEGSDIDLAVEGLTPPDALFRAGAELEDLARPFRVDLVPLEDAWPEVREKILRLGELLHDSSR